MGNCHFFSGDPKVKGGEVPIESWKYEVECLQGDKHLDTDTLGLIVRRSLRGGGRADSSPHGCGASVNDIVQKLEGLYGTVESGAVLLQQLSDSKQGAEESISSYSARLQLAINKAEQRGGISPRLVSNGGVCGSGMGTGWGWGRAHTLSRQAPPVVSKGWVESGEFLNAPLRDNRGGLVSKGCVE